MKHIKYKPLFLTMKYKFAKKPEKYPECVCDNYDIRLRPEYPGVWQTSLHQQAMILLQSQSLGK
jgi:hypothetical protein